jgi:hypothetical protein
MHVNTKIPFPASLISPAAQHKMDHSSTWMASSSGLFLTCVRAAHECAAAAGSYLSVHSHLLILADAAGGLKKSIMMRLRQMNHAHTGRILWLYISSEWIYEWPDLLLPAAKPHHRLMSGALIALSLNQLLSDQLVLSTAPVIFLLDGPDSACFTRQSCINHLH